MLRRAYLLSLLVLQFALVTEVVPALAEALRLRAAIAQAAGSDDAILRLAVAVLGTIGGGIALVAPLFALLRHRQRGPLRFLGLPRWAVIGQVAGATLFVGCTLAAAWLSDLDHPLVDALVALERPLALAATTLMGGGALAAELLRRSVAPPRLLRDLMPARSRRIEVVHPDDLRTSAR
jgi:hypothetical protein